jgi:hypothetical protein
VRTIGQIARAFLQARRRRRARLPWRELEAEAARQGCSPADIFFDRAGRMVGLPVAPEMTAAWTDETEKREETRWLS